MGADCPPMNGRPAPLGIAQDADCVTWDKLVALRTLYNEVWDLLDECGVAEGNKYGDEGLGMKHEIDSLPTVEGFFRLTVVSTSDDHGGYDITPGDIEFILSGGTLLTRINDASYTYLDPDGPFHMVLKDPCNNCSKLHPNGRVPATKTVGCPEGGEYTIYDGYYALDFSAAPDACGILRDWADSLDILRDHIDMFPSTKEESSVFDCHETILSCCDLYDKAHYERVDGRFVLKYIDIFVDADGKAAMEGYLTTLVTAADLSDIVARVSSDVSHFGLSEDYHCDKCGISGYVISPNPEECELEDKTNFPCDTPLTWERLVRIEAVVGYTAPGGEPLGCHSCSNVSVEGRFFADEIICTCGWEELAALLGFLIDHCCVFDCEGEAGCPSALDLTVSIIHEHNLSNANNCGINVVEGGENHYYRRVEERHTNVNCHCFGTPGVIFNCDFTYVNEISGARTDPCGDCGSLSSSVEPESWDDCVIGNCGTTFNVACDTDDVEIVNIDEITQAEVVAAAEASLGSSGDCLLHEVNDFGMTDRIRCGRAVPLEGYVGFWKLDTISGYAERHENSGFCQIIEDTITIELHGTSLGVKPITLHWTQTIDPFGTPIVTEESEVFLLSNAWKIVIHVATPAGVVKTVNNFWTS